jgi:SHS2 domain-containing protein
VSDPEAAPQAGRSPARSEVQPSGVFEFVEGATSDIAFEARGETLPALFAAAAEAVLAATVANPEAVEERQRERLDLREPDLELLLLRFLNELVFLRDARGLLLRAGRLTVEQDGEARLVGELAGEPIERGRHRLEGDVKAATAHGLAVERDAGGWRATVTLDV